MAGNGPDDYEYLKWGKEPWEVTHINPYWERIITTEMIEIYGEPEPNRAMFSFDYGNGYKVVAKYLMDRPVYKIIVSSSRACTRVAEFELPRQDGYLPPEWFLR